MPDSASKGASKVPQGPAKAGESQRGLAVRQLGANGGLTARQLDSSKTLTPHTSLLIKIIIKTSERTQWTLVAAAWKTGDGGRDGRPVGPGQAVGARMGRSHWAKTTGRAGSGRRSPRERRGRRGQDDQSWSLHFDVCFDGVVQLKQTQMCERRRACARVPDSTRVQACAEWVRDYACAEWVRNSM